VFLWVVGQVVDGGVGSCGFAEYIDLQVRGVSDNC